MVASLVNKDNSHVGGLLSSNQGAVKGFGGKVIGADGKCKGIKQYGGKKHKRHTKKKSHKKKHNKNKKRTHKKRTHKKRTSHKKSVYKKRVAYKKRKKTRKYRKKGGAVLEPQRPIHGLHSVLTRGGNASRGLSPSEKAKLIGGGTGYGMTAENATMQSNTGTPSGIGMGNHKSAGVNITGYKNCNLTPDFKMGAGSNWKSLNSIQKGAGMINKYNNITSGSYGYVPEGDNKSFAGSYAPVKPLVRSQQCGKGGKKQKGGYAQYHSNTPLTHTQQIPNGAQGGSLDGQLAIPPTFSRANLCRDNYNHFTGMTMRSPVLDKNVKS